ncbi:arginyl-tRNA synthetase [Neoconidiobolus thromboides FSU 785]|nr:arginyl-tRNA synthetase [Neoconidiobolus thromboides FSU 785]
MDSFKQEIAKQVSEFSGVPVETLLTIFEAPKNPEHGDVALAIPRLRLKGNPAQFAKEYAEKIQSNDYIKSASAAGIFLNIKINRDLLRDLLLKEVVKSGEKYGVNTSGNGKKILVEFSSPNIAKPFHAGHLRSTIIGNFIAKAHTANGYETTTMNYLGDWGKQYGLLALGFGLYGSEEKLEADPIGHLFEVYVKINADAENDDTIHDQARAYFKKIEDGDEEVLKLWSRFRNLSIEKYKQTYARLNINFDVYSGESQVNEYMQRANKLLEEKGLLVESKGAQIIDLEKFKLGKVVVRKSDGTTLYITRDIGAAIQRYETYNFDEMYYIVASQQDLHFKQLFKILELLELDWVKKCHHINYGLVTGMSTRKGNVVFLDDILQEAKDTMHGVMKKNEHKYAQIESPEEVADIIGISAVVVQDLSARRIRNYEFNMSQMVSFEGDTGPYLQYAHSRLSSVIRKANREINLDHPLDTLKEECASELVDMISQYPDIVKGTVAGFEPCSVVHYAFGLSRSISTCLEQLWVMNQPEELANPRLVLFNAAKITLGNAMRLLGLTPLDRM